MHCVSRLKKKIKNKKVLNHNVQKQVELRTNRPINVDIDILCNV